MADVSSRLANCQKLWRLTGNLLDLCFDCRITARGAIKDLDRINDQIVELRSVLDQLVKAATASEPPPLRWFDLDEVMLECNNELEALEVTMKQSSEVKRDSGVLNSSSEVVTKGALHNLDRSTRELKDILDVAPLSQIENVEASLTHTNHFDYRNSNTFNVLGDQIHYHMSNSDDDLRQKIHSWLSTSDPSPNQNDATKLRELDTGLWFIDGMQFKEWKTAANSLLWLRGIPGCGKTVMCSMVIEELGTHCQDNPRRLALAYFYFSFSDLQKQLSENLIRSLVMQFSIQCGSYSESLGNLYFRCQQGARQPSLHDLLQVLRQLIEVFDHAYIVIDALDECNDQDGLLASIAEITSWGIESLHVLCAGREERVIEDGLCKLSAVQVLLDRESVDRDIWTHLHSRLREDSRFNKWNPEERLEIETALVGGAHGMFRWVSCQLDALAKCSTLHMLRKALQSLPKTLDETYERILLKINEENQCLALKVLRWLAFAGRSMTLEEMAEILAIDDSDTLPQYDTDQLLRDPRDILAICSSLISVSTTCIDYLEKDVVQLAHFSVKEYLVSQRSETGPASRYHLSEAPATMSISRDCLAYLLHLDESQGIKDSLSSLCQYAAEYWVTYAAHAPPACLEMIQPLMINLFQAGSAQFVHWARLLLLDDIDDPYSFTHPQSYKRARNYVDPREDHDQPLSALSMPLYCASLLGLEGLADHLVSGVSADRVNLNGGRFGTALAAASFAGHERIVRLLLEKGADVNAGGRTREATPLILSCANGDRSIVQLLLENNADANLLGQDWDPLSVASREGHADIVTLLLDNGADANSCTYDGTTALIAAIKRNHHAVAHLLLDYGADTSCCTYDGTTALIAAIKMNNCAITKRLLDNGADVNFSAENGVTALMMASATGYEAIALLLLEKGADVNACTDQGETALIHASWWGYEAIALLLLEHGADVNCCTEEGDTALMAASQEGEEYIVSNLLLKGANVNFCAEKGETALIYASRHGHKEIVHLLLEDGADVDFCTEKGTTALLAASEQRQCDTVQVLLNNGANVNFCTEKGGTALIRASWQGYEDLVQTLLDNGADVNFCTEEGVTALRAASQEGEEYIARILLENGADIAMGGERALEIVPNWQDHRRVAEPLSNIKRNRAETFGGQSSFITSANNDHSTFAAIPPRSGGMSDPGLCV